MFLGIPKGCVVVRCAGDIENAGAVQGWRQHFFCALDQGLTYTWVRMAPHSRLYPGDSSHTHTGRT
jgi:hypothetical protein